MPPRAPLRALTSLLCASLTPLLAGCPPTALDPIVTTSDSSEDTTTAAPDVTTDDPGVTLTSAPEVPDSTTGDPVDPGATTGATVGPGDTTGSGTTGSDTTGSDTTGRDTTGNDTTGNDTTGNDTTGNDTTGNDTTGNDTTGDATGTTDGVVSDTDTGMDSGAPNEPLCMLGPSFVQVSGMTPEGPFTAVSGAFGIVKSGSYHGITLFFADVPADDDPLVFSGLLNAALQISPMADTGPTDMGLSYFRPDIEGAFGFTQGTITKNTQDPEKALANEPQDPWPVVAGSFELHEDGWDLVGEFEIPYCAALDQLIPF